MNNIIMTADNGRKITKDDVVSVCKYLLINTGNIEKTYNDINFKSTDIPIERYIISFIKYREIGIDISNKYFDDTTFKSNIKQLTDSTVHLICETLLICNGDIGDTCVRVNRSLGRQATSYSMIKEIKYKNIKSHISDQYFDKDTFNNMKDENIYHLKAKDVNALYRILTSYDRRDIQSICEILIKHNHSLDEAFTELMTTFDKNIEYHQMCLVNNKLLAQRKRTGVKTFAKARMWLNDTEAHLICQALVRYQGNTQRVFEELCPVINCITDQDISRVKNKYSNKKISDEYFDENMFILVRQKSYTSIEKLIDEVIDSLGIVDIRRWYRKIIYEIFSMSRYDTNFLLRTCVRTEPSTNRERTFYTDDKGRCHVSVVRYSIGYNVILNKPLDDDASLMIEEVNNDGEVTLTLKFKVKIKDQ